jgi:chaperonin cofactor prefoldin
MNENKTSDEKKLYESTVNCRKHNAYSKMMGTKEYYEKTDGIQGFHIIQSFKPGEITSGLAHEIGLKFVEKCFKNRFEVVIGTHLDKGHIHNHIIINSVSCKDGRKYRNDFKDYFKDIRGISDDLCREYGLSIIMPDGKRLEEGKNLTYLEWLARNEKRTSWQSLIRMDIDDCINQAYDIGNFLVLMRLKGYEIKQGKYISFRPLGKDRFSRGYKLGHEYSLENIQRRIAGLRATAGFKDMQTYVNQKYDFKPFPKVKKGSFRALCLHYMYLLGQVKKNKAPDRVSNLMKEDLIRFEAMIKTINFTKLRNLDTVESVERYKDKCFDTIALIKREQGQIKNDELSRLFGALVDRSRYARAYSLYRDEGFAVMKAEHDKFVTAVRTLKEAGYETDAQIQTLIDKQSEMESKLAQLSSDIRHFRYEIKLCNKALELNCHMQSKKDALQRMEHDEQNIVEPVR